jgi:uncharacterized damage-inducible protein DinB
MDDLIPLTVSMLSTTPVRWENLVRSLPEDLLRRKPDPQNWSALECLQHILDTEKVFQFRIQAFLDGIDFPSFDPDVHPPAANEASPQLMSAEFTRLRDAGLAAVRNLTETDLDRRVRHQELGPVTLREMLFEWSAHDLMHTVQAERALMQPFIAGSGPWIKFFADHVAPAG